MKKKLILIKIGRFSGITILINTDFYYKKIITDGGGGGMLKRLSAEFL